MNKKIRSMWIYSILIFCVAILLIIVSEMTQTRISPNANTQEKFTTQISQELDQDQKVFNQTIQQSLSEIMDEKSNLEDTIKKQETKINEFEQKSNSLQQENEGQKREIEAKDMLLQAISLYNSAQYKKSKDMIMNVDRNVLGDDITKIYDNLVKQLSNKGYKFN